MILTPPKSGLVHGIITFASKDNQYLWYTIELEVKLRNTQSNIKMQMFNLLKFSLINIYNKK